MRLLIEDLRGRKPFMVGLVYGLAACALVVLGLFVLPAAGAPEWALNLLVATLFIPFPFVVILVWALTAEPPENAKASPAQRARELATRPPPPR
jgi:hypothetical protein